MAETLDGRDADLVAPLELRQAPCRRLRRRTREAMGGGSPRRSRRSRQIDEVVLPGDFDCDEADDRAGRASAPAMPTALIAVGSGIARDSCKYATFLDGRPYAIFGTAASMNGYAASTASVTLPTATRRRCRRMRRAAFSSISSIGRSADLASAPRALATACAGRPRRSTGGPRTACSAPLFGDALCPPERRRSADDRRRRRPRQA